MRSTVAAPKKFFFVLAGDLEPLARFEGEIDLGGAVVEWSDPPAELR
jgi:hypothetical protein